MKKFSALIAIVLVFSVQTAYAQADRVAFSCISERGVGYKASTLSPIYFRPEKIRVLESARSWTVEVYRPNDGWIDIGSVSKEDSDKSYIQLAGFFVGGSFSLHVPSRKFVYLNANGYLFNGKDDPQFAIGTCTQQ